MKKYLPNFLIDFISKLRFLKSLFCLNIYDSLIFYRYSNGFYKCNTKGKILDYIIVTYHPIEKGLTMPELRLGFGHDRLLKIIFLIRKYMNMYKDYNPIICDALSVISEYYELHNNKNYNIDSKLESEIINILSDYPEFEKKHQYNFSKTDFFSNCHSNFYDFAKSRRSVRNYLNKDINLKDLEAAISLAMTAPSTCNRQSVRIHIVQSKDLIEKTLSLQSGNRGFGQLTNKLLIISSDLQSWNIPGEKYSPYIDGGIFTMNLLYALHFYKIGACTLNWSEGIKSDKKLHKLLNIPTNEKIILMISCGLVPENFKVVRSDRKDYKTIMHIH